MGLEVLVQRTAVAETSFTLITRVWLVSLLHLKVLAYRIVPTTEAITTVLTRQLFISRIRPLVLVCIATVIKVFAAIRTQKHSSFSFINVILLADLLL